MNIAIIAPEKFAFQDLVCIELGLRFRHLTGAQLFAEPDGGEDARLEFIRSGVPVVVEVQVKGSAGSLDLAGLASFLAHFPDRVDEGTLLDRLIEDKRRFALFVISGRCADNASPYLITRLPEGIEERVVSARSGEDFLIHYAQVLGPPPEKESKLWKGRREHLAKTPANGEMAAIRSALGRVLIIEQRNADDLSARCRDFLSEVGVPSGSSTHALDELCRRTQSAKKERSDLLPAFGEVIERHAPSTMRPNDYIPRGTEDQFFSDLLRTYVLLLSGSPRAGKTFAASALAGRLQLDGFEAKKCFSVTEAARFLLDGSASRRVAVLDDPFGGSHAVQGPSQEIVALRNLVLQTNASKLLIVVQAKDRIFEAFRTSSLAGAKLQHHSWVDLDTHSADLAARIWANLNERGVVSDDLYRLIADAIGRDGITLEPGFLTYLAFNSDRLSTPPSLDEALRLAQEDASDLGRALVLETSKELLQVLAVGTSPGIPIALEELAFLTNFDRADLPGFIEINGKMSGFPAEADDQKSPAAAGYDPKPQLADNYKNFVEGLEVRRIVHVSKDMRISLVHPVFRAASESAVDFSSVLARDSVLKLIEKALLCLSPHTAKAAAKNLSWIAERVAKADLNDIFRLAERGLGSIFISTRDICFSFLVGRMGEADSKLQDRMQGWIGRASFISLDDVVWTDGEATLSSLDGDGIIHVPSSIEDILDVVDVAAVNTFTEDSMGRCSARVAWDASRYFEQNPSEMTLSYMHRLLSYDEASIRAKAISSWLREDRADDYLILNRIASERHPHVMTAVLDALSDCWPKLDDARRECVLSVLTAGWSVPYAAAVMIHRCLVMDKRHTFEAWDLLGEILPVVLRQLPASVRFNDARLHGIVSRGVPHLHEAERLAICEAWVGLVARINQTRTPTAYELAVAEIIVQALPVGPKRLRLLSELLETPGTSVPARTLAEISYEWAALSVGERELVAKLLAQPRSDSHWLSAALLTRRFLDAGLLDLLLCSQGWSNEAHLAMRERLPPLVLRACLAMYASDTNVFHILNLNGSDTTYLEQELDSIALDPNDPYFSLAWAHITNFGDDARILGLVERWPGASLEPVFERLFAALLRGVEDLPKSWKLLLSKADSQDMRSTWLERMASSGSRYLDQLSDVSAWLSGQDLKDFIDHFKYDLILLRLDVSEAKFGGFNGRRGEDLVKLVDEIFKNWPPALHGTCSRVQGMLKRMGYSETDLYQRIEVRRGELIDGRSSSGEYHQVEPEGWIFPNADLERL